jgi:hypothetical protein
MAALSANNIQPTCLEPVDAVLSLRFVPNFEMTDEITASKSQNVFMKIQSSVWKQTGNDDREKSCWPVSLLRASLHTEAAIFVSKGREVH